MICRKLSPSSFAFLWEECRRCFYLTTVSAFPRPRGIMPKIFTVIDSAMKNCFEGKRTETIAKGIPPSRVVYGDKWVESSPIAVPGHATTCFVRGKTDTILQFDDGSYGIVDFKTSSARSEHIPLYARQLMSYAIALENPAPGALALKPVSRLGLIIYEPNLFVADSLTTAYLKGGMHWVEIPRDDAAFMKFLGEVLDVLELPQPPGGSPSCEWCRYRDARANSGIV